MIKTKTKSKPRRRWIAASILLCFAIMAFCSKPDAASFKRCLKRQAAAEAGTGATGAARRLLIYSQIELLDLEYHDLGFASIVVIHGAESQPRFLGLFGCWRRLPAINFPAAKRRKVQP
jgi:hypothetical protein